ncbi:nitrite reductase [Porphyromonadaceae bacterium COT-184 OH4590]|nr:nitrite reductase [Porphyromonadaceae bacterium COT-184 OH4590]MDO4726715.1 (2Fe-2S)-binding protein [Porphyromonadaceae bacterium]
MSRDEQICNCMGITRGEIEDAIKAKGLKTVEEVGEETSAGTVCGGCQDQIQEIIDEING